MDLTVGKKKMVVEMRWWEVVVMAQVAPDHAMTWCVTEAPDSIMGSSLTFFLTWSDSPVRELSSIFRSLPWIRTPSAGRRSPGAPTHGGHQGQCHGVIVLHYYQTIHLTDVNWRRKTFSQSSSGREENIFRHNITTSWEC